MAHERPSPIPASPRPRGRRLRGTDLPVSTNASRAALVALAAAALLIGAPSTVTAEGLSEPPPPASSALETGAPPAPHVVASAASPLKCGRSPRPQDLGRCLRASEQLPLSDRLAMVARAKAKLKKRKPRPSLLGALRIGAIAPEAALRVAIGEALVEAGALSERSIQLIPGPRMVEAYVRAALRRAPRPARSRSLDHVDERTIRQVSADICRLGEEEKAGVFTVICDGFIGCIRACKARHISATFEVSRKGWRARTFGFRLMDDATCGACDG